MMKLVISSIPLTPSPHRLVSIFRSGMTLSLIRCSKERGYSSQFPLRYVPKKARPPGVEKEFFSVEDLGKKDEFGCRDVSTSGLKNAHKLEVNPINNGEMQYKKEKWGSLFEGDCKDEDHSDHELLTKSDETVGDENLGENEFELNVQRGSTGSKEDAEMMAIKLLAARAYTALELKKKLIGKKFTVAVIDAVISDFRVRGLINDSLYAETYSRSRWMSSTWGPGRIKQALLTKGVNASDMEKAVNSVFQEGQCDEEEDTKHGLSQASMDHLYAQASKHWLRSQSVHIDTRKSRIIRWLQYRGFNWSVISFILKKLESL